MRHGSVTLALLAAVFASACQLVPARVDHPSTTPVRGGTLTVALEDDVLDLDPLSSRAFTDRDVHYQIYDSLVRIDPAGNIVPWLASSWVFSGDGRRLTFQLRDGIRFHDGMPFDASSVKWNLDRYRTAKGSARTGELSAVEAVEVVDRLSVEVILRTPFAGLLATLVDRAGMMVSSRAVEAAGESFTRNAFRAGTGPFILTEAVKDDHLTLERNREWWGRDSDGDPLPYLDRVVVKPIVNSDIRTTNLRAGVAQVMNRVAAKDVATLAADTSLSYQEKPAFGFGSLVPNRMPGFLFSEVRYIKAVSMAIDRQEILDTVFHGVGRVGYGAIAPPHFAFDPSFAPFARADAEGAKRLVRGVGRGPLRFELLIVAGDPQTLQMAQLIQAQLARAEIITEIKQLQLAEVLRLQEEKRFPGLALFGWSGRIDPDGNTFDQLHTRGTFNLSGYSNPEVDRLLDLQRTTLDQTKRRSALRAAEQIYAVDDPARIWYRFGVAQLLTARTVHGMEPYPDLLMRLHTAWLGR